MVSIAACLSAATVISVAALVDDGSLGAPIPSDPLELVTSRPSAVDSPQTRSAALKLLDRARYDYLLRAAGVGYDLKTTFSVNSGGVTDYDGDWGMEDVFDPKQGFRWTANGPAAYSATRIYSNGNLYGEATGNYIPLRLQEARAALFDPIPSAERVDRAAMRMASANFNGRELTCILLSAPRAAASASGRAWNETEECIDPQSGLLQTHSQVPGRYYAYDYSNAPRLADHILPRKVTVTEGGRSITQISVESLTEIPAVDPGLFAPGQEMQMSRPPVRLGGAQKILHVFGQGPAVRTVCVFGVLSPWGQLMEAHSLQPSDPNSQAAVEAARAMSFPAAASGSHPEQHFVFVIQTFLSPAESAR